MNPYKESRDSQEIHSQYFTRDFGKCQQAGISLDNGIPEQLPLIERKDHDIPYAYKGRR